MKNKSKINKILVVIVLTICLPLNVSHTAHAFDLNTINGVTALPMDYINNYYIARTCSSSAFYPILNAVNAWNSAPPTKFRFNLVNGPVNSNYNGSVGDGISTIGQPISDSELVSLGYYSSVAVNFLTGTVNGPYFLVYESDIVYNTSAIFGIGDSVNFFDWQGVFTHELGHSIGLNDIYSYSGGISNLPTMWYTDTYQQYNNVSYHLRSLTTDDMNGKAAVALIRDF